MKQIILYSIMIGSGIVNLWLGVSIAKQKATIAEQSAAIKEQREMIERLAQQEAIAIHITNQFKSTAVLGKTIVDANVHNVADQVASILKGELNGGKIPIKPELNGH